MERFINILIIDQDPKIRNGLKEILSGSGNNTILADDFDKAIQLVSKREFGIILINLDDSDLGSNQLTELRESSHFANSYILLITKNDQQGSKLVKGMNQGAVDFITYPFRPNLVRSKLDVYKSLYFKDQRIGQLLSNIFPTTILSELSSNGKFSPKRIQNGVVIFTDFVDFSSNSKETQPLLLIKKLEYYFTRFDEIIKKYKLEKIKTIGDAYMALGGVTEDLPHPAIRACLASLEIRDFMRTERDLAIAFKKDFWEIRIGLHMGPLVAGIIGASKFSFDVWGDTVNIASRAESASRNGQITITSAIQKEVEPYFLLQERGHVDIHKRGGNIEMFYLQRLKPEYTLKKVNRSASPELRSLCGLPSMDFEFLHQYIINRLRSLLPETISYHDIWHSLNVEKAAMRYAALEGIGEDELVILRTAVLFHDAGFIRKYRHNEDFAIQMARSILPEFGYKNEQVEQICSIINCTKFEVEPKNLLEMIMCDADHDYLGRPDYHSVVNKLRLEMSHFEQSFTDVQWIDYQLDFLENQHVYYTETAKNLRLHGKLARTEDLKKRKHKLQQ